MNLKCTYNFFFEGLTIKIMKIMYYTSTVCRCKIIANTMCYHSSKVSFRWMWTDHALILGYIYLAQLHCILILFAYSQSAALHFAQPLVWQRVCFTKANKDIRELSLSHSGKLFICINLPLSWIRCCIVNLIRSIFSNDIF